MRSKFEQLQDAQEHEDWGRLMATDQRNMRFAYELIAGDLVVDTTNIVDEDSYYYVLATNFLSSDFFNDTKSTSRNQSNEEVIEASNQEFPNLTRFFNFYNMIVVNDIAQGNIKPNAVGHISKSDLADNLQNHITNWKETFPNENSTNSFSDFYDYMEDLAAKIEAASLK